MLQRKKRFFFLSPSVWLKCQIFQMIDGFLFEMLETFYPISSYPQANIIFHLTCIRRFNKFFFSSHLSHPPFNFGFLSLLYLSCFSLSFAFLCSYISKSISFIALRWILYCFVVAHVDEKMPQKKKECMKGAHTLRFYRKSIGAHFSECKSDRNGREEIKPDGKHRFYEKKKKKSSRVNRNEWKKKELYPEIT